MSCREYRAQVMEFARGGALGASLAAHLDACPECTELAERQLALTAAMRALAAEAPEPPGREAGLRAEFERRRRRRWSRWIPPAAAAIAASLLAGVVLIRKEPAPAPPPPPVPMAVVPPAAAPPVPVPKPVRRRQVARRARPRDPDAAEARPFVPIPYTEPLEPYERAAVVRAEIPVAAFIAAGFQVRTPDPGVRIQADLLVGADGRARAIRPVSFTSYR